MTHRRIKTSFLPALLLLVAPLLGGVSRCEPDPDPVVDAGSEGEACGDNTCGNGEYCCNASCGTCAAEGEFCTAIACEPADGGSGGEVCGDAVCGDGEYCCNESCGICAPEGGSCIALECEVADGGVAPSDCRATGCSGQVCADEDVVTTCEWREEYACYDDATCERQADGACGWTPTDELAECLGGGTDPEPCVVTGCSSHVCAEEPVTTTCEYRPEYACYRDATCERQDDGVCGWTPTDELTTCLDDGTRSEPTCRVTGCSGQLCASENIDTTCEFRPEYACYRDAACEVQDSGDCGWTPSEDLTSCLASSGTSR